MVIEGFYWGEWWLLGLGARSHHNFLRRKIGTSFFRIARYHRRLPGILILGVDHAQNFDGSGSG